MRNLHLFGRAWWPRYLALVLFLGSVISASGQITVKGKSLSMIQVIQQIEKNSDYTFFYNTSDLERIPGRTLDCNGSIEEVLKEVFGKNGVSYIIKNNEIVLKVDTKQVVQQVKKERTVKGTVLDAMDGSPIIGANVMVKGVSGKGTITDIDGGFSIDVADNTVLEFSFIGYRKQEIYITDQGVINVKMESDSEVLSEVVVVGAGTQKKVSVTGAITSVKGTNLSIPSSSLTEGFAGKLAGVISMTNSGEPGAASEFYIRGVSTFGGRATPLILMDGVEITTSDLNRIPAESIESFSILKDASATAIYGARGANGVMLVTTKSGTENQKAKINVSLENSFLQPTKQVEYVDGATWMEIYNEAQVARTPNITPKYSTEAIDATRKHIAPYIYPDVDWMDLLFKKMTMNQRANINISGGGSRVTYYMSLQGNHDTGMLNVPKTYSYDNNIDNWNYIFQNNIGYKVSNTTKLNLRMNAQFGKFKGPGYSVKDLFTHAYEANPISFPATYPMREGDEHINFGTARLSGNDYYMNPYAQMLSSFKEENYSTLNTSLSIDQDLSFITKGLKVTALVNLKNWSTVWYTQSIEPYYYHIKQGSWDLSNPNEFELERMGNSGTDFVTQSGASRNSNSTFYFDARLDYARTFGEHSVSGMLMYMQREYRADALPNRNQGFSGRFTYDYGHRYLAEFNFGYNGTERLKKGDRFEFFPAMSLGWVISGEEFWEPVQDYVGYFKLRGSYGVVGSDETGSGAGHFLYLDNIGLNAGGYTTGVTGNITKNGPAFHSYAVQGACWERVNKLDIGADIELFNQLNITADYFYDHRYNILLHRGSWPVILGYAGAVPWSSIGSVDNKGFEVSVNWKKEIVKDLMIDFRANLTYNKNKFIETDEPAYPYVWQTETGKPLSRTTGYIAEGLFSSEEEIANSPVQNLGSAVMPGDIKYRDVNGDGMITTDDKVMISPYGNVPRIQYGLGMNLAYKNFDFGVFFNGSAKRTIMTSGIAPFCAGNNRGDRNLMTYIADNYWSENNPDPDAAYPRLGVTEGQVKNNMEASSYWMHNGNFLRFKTLEVGYTFPYCRVYFSGDNLAVWSPFKLWDPELAWNSYPLSRTFNIGVQLKF